MKATSLLTADHRINEAVATPANRFEISPTRVCIHLQQYSCEISSSTVIKKAGCET